MLIVNNWGLTIVSESSLLAKTINSDLKTHI